MNKRIRSLLAILIIQLGMVVGLFLTESDMMDTSIRDPLAPFDPDAIDEIHIADDQGNEAVLLKLEDHWILPDLSGLPINPHRIDTLISSISDAHDSRPIADSAASRQRFQVAEYHYQRRLTFIGEGALLGTIYLGTSPGFRKVHARNDAQDAIHSISFSNFHAPPHASAWLNLELLQVEHPQKISNDEFSLTKTQRGWVSKQTQIPDAAELERLLMGLRNIEVTGIADDKMLQNLAIAAPTLTLYIDTKNASISLSFVNVGENYFVHSSQYKQFFTLNRASIESLLTIYPPALNNTLPNSEILKE